jgi:hypothetical protein
MLLNLILFYLLSYIISYKIIFFYVLLVNILNKYVNSVTSIVFYICLPYNMTILFLTCIRLKLGRYKYYKKYAKFKRKIKNYYWSLRKRYRKYKKRVNMNNRIKNISKKITEKQNQM